jgi:SHAQKYF class myb-like DNA-binding protein
MASGGGVGKVCATGKDRLRWTPVLSMAFEDAVRKTGGIDCTTPSAIVEELRPLGLTVGQIKSHLQKVRRDRFQSQKTSREPATAREILLKAKLEDELKRLPFEC